MKSKNLLSTLGSIAAASMVIRTIVNDFLPPQVMNYFSCKLENLSHHFTSQITIVIEEFRGLAVNQVFEAADIYLGSKTAAPSIQRVKVGKSEKDNKLALSMDRGGILVDVFEKVEMKWQLVCSPVDSVPSRNQNNGGDLNSSLRSEVRRYELSFHKRNKDLVIDSYLPYVLERAKLMREENKTINLHTVVYGRWDVEEIKLKHPMTFNTLAMDSELKRAVMVDLQHFTNGEEYYKRVCKAWKRGYLLYGSPGTGKSSLIAAMANYLKYDIYDLDLTDVHTNSDLRFLLLTMPSRSILIIEDIDCSIKLQNRELETESDGNQGDNQVTLSGLLNFIDGLWSCCNEERIIIFTTNHKERLDPALVRPGRMDMHICFMSGAKFEVAKFDGQGNFGLWQTREELQQRAAGTIRLCLADEVMYHVMHLSSPDEIWRKLESQFMSKSLTTKLYLKQRLYGLKMQDDHDLAQHVNVFNQIVSDLARLDVKIEDEDRAMILLCSLPSSYEHMVTTLTYGKETINVEEITAALLAHNQQKQNTGESSQADSLYVKGNRDRGRKPEKAGSGKRNSRSKSRDKKTIHCYKCKEAGHMKRDCPKLKKQTDEKRDGSTKSVNVVEDDTSDCSEGDMLSISTTQLTDAWILDSGCSYHITPNREWFSTYRPVNSGSVYLGDDRCCNIGIGDVRIKMHDGSVRTLSGVRHIPDLKKNLISLGTLHKNGFIPKADEDRETIRIVKGALTVMKGKMTAGNIYRLLGSTVAGGVHSVESCDDTTKLWHMRLAHLSERGMAELHKRNLLHGVKSCKLDFCRYCVIGKQTKVRFKIAKHTTQGILDYVHSDKSEVFEKFKLWKAEVENQTGRKIKCLRSDNGTKYTDSQFLQFCKEHGIQRHFTVRKTPQQNGVAERMNRSLNERARCLRLNAGLPKHFWAEAVNMACYLINRSPRASLAGKVAEEVWTGHDVSFDNLRIFGCPAYVHVPADERSKLDAKSKECIFLGYNKGVKGFKFWDPVAKKVVISRDVVFDEQSMLQQKQDTTVVDFDQFPVEKPETSQPNSGGSTTDDLQDYSLARDRVRRTNIKPPNRLGFEDLVSFALTVSSDDPVTFHDAVTSQENDKWMAAMIEEMESLNHNRTWELVPLPEGKKQIGCKWVYKKKPAVIEKGGRSSRLVWHTSIRAVLALVASWDLHLEQMDVKTAFLHGDLEEHIYMRQPEGFTQPGNEHLVCRLKKSLYGLKQSPRQWYKRFDSYMIKIGYNRCEYDCCVYVKSLDDGSFIFLLLYVDEMLIAAKNMDDVIGLKTLLSQEFDMKDLGAAKKILGMEICRDRDSRKLRLSQRGYVEKMLERFAMSSAKPVSTPLANHFKLSSEQCPKTDKEAEDMAKVPYSNAVGCLMYAMVCTRPDLAHAVSQVCKYMSKPGKQHWEAVKWIFRYLKGTVGHGIVFGSQRDNPLVVGYVDSDYAGDLDNRRSTTGYVFTLGGGPICWKSTVQSVVALSTTEAEYMAAAEAAKEALWLTGLVKELGVQQGGVQLLCDNQSAIHLAKNQVYRARTKHIDVRFHKIRELVASGEVLFQKVHTDENAADMFTKPVTTDKFKHCLDLLNVSSC
ncbi:pentatricopeptide repeat-containing protein [Hibiscus syriacus]|uniref:Pentatricopeptide repeat-containing protein n=1 Tax=Hibiscus syriacus TaxID=106335 RepID=A0A6A2YNB1_HIBSY|nr:pentatricopeptide repeat-containing protein [Hibiscus syriacus]